MDTRQLAHSSAVLLSAYLPFLWHDNIPTTEDRGRWEAIKALWKTLRPALENSQGALQSAMAAAEDPTEATLSAFSGLLADLLAANEALAKEVEVDLAYGPLALALGAVRADSSPASLKQQADEWRQRIIRSTGGRPAASGQAAGGGVPACAVCGRQDATLRIVVFPYVVSLILITLRRAYSGLWCARHARLRQFQAALITASIGWMGFPFGLFYAPAALLKLARGGDQPADINQRMLMELARHKLHTGNDPQGAIRCLEAALEFGDAPAVETDLRSLYQSQARPSGGGWLLQIALFAAALAGAWLIGNVIGLADYFISTGFSAALGEEMPFLIGLLTWVPLLAMLAAGGLLLVQMVEAALRRARTRRSPLAIVLAAAASLLAIYGIPTGIVLADTLVAAPLAQTFSNPLTALYILSWTFSRGGWMLMSQYFTAGAIAEAVYLAILVLAGALYLVSTIHRASAISAGQRRVDAIYREATGDHPHAAASGWLSILGAGLGLGVLLVISGIPALGGAQYGDPAAMDRFMQGMEQFEAGDVAGARAAFEEARTIDPDSFVPYLGLSYVEMTLDNCSEAVEYLETTRTLAPPDMQAVVTRGLGAAHRCHGQPDEAIALYEEALANDPSQTDIHLEFGLAYLLKGEAETAVEHFTTASDAREGWASAYALLALTYYYLDQPQQEAEALQQALAQPLDESNEFTCLASYYYVINDFEQAETYLKQGLETPPPDVSNLLALASVNVWQGDFDEAMQVADRILALDAANGDAFFVQSMVYEEQGDFQRARQVAEQGLALDPNNEILGVQLGYLAFDEGDYEAAIGQAEAIIAQYPYYGGAYRLLALSQMEAGRLDEALAAAQEVLKLEPKSDIPYYVMGVYSMQAGDNAAAIEAFETFLSLTWDRRLTREYQQQAEAFLAELRQ